MNTVPKQGTKVVLSAVDADGLAIALAAAAVWSLASADFAMVVADDGLSATVTPNGPSAAATLVVTSGNLTVTADLSYVNVAPPARVPAKLNLVFTDLPAEAPAPVPPVAVDPNLPGPPVVLTPV